MWTGDKELQPINNYHVMKDQTVKIITQEKTEAMRA
jgi:hypothetical protein